MPETVRQLRHVAIIMDGNGRWADRRGLSKAEGHRQGAKQVSEVLQAACDCGVEILTLYAFSTENWKRPPQEVAALMSLLEEFLDDKRSELLEKNIRLRAVGRTEKLPAGVRRRLFSVIEATRSNTGGTLNLALNYGGRAEIVDAVNRILEAPPQGKITEETFRDWLYAPDLPDPDLLIRTSGELRLSNFLLWQLSYTELYVTDTLWPEFGRAEFMAAVEAFGRRERRFGGRK